LTVENDIFQCIKGLCGNRVYRKRAPLGVVKPYVTFAQVGGVALSPLANVVADKKNGRFQFNVWGDESDATSTLMLNIEKALVESTVFQAEPIGAHANNDDEDMNLYGFIHQFSIWSTR